MPLPEAKEKVTKFFKVVSKGATPVVALEEGTSANHGDIQGINASMLKNLTMAKKLLKDVIPPFDQEEVVKLDLDRKISKLFYGVG